MQIISKILIVLQFFLTVFELGLIRKCKCFNENFI